MSATEKLQQHPAFQQAQNKASYYISQLDKEVHRPARNSALAPR